MEIDSMFRQVSLLANGIFTVNLDEAISYTLDGHNSILKHEENSFWYAHRNLCLKELVESASVKEIVDLGGGNGFTSQLFQNLGINTILLEPGLNGTMNAKRRGIKKIVHGSLKTTAAMGNSCPNIGIFDVLEHIEDDKDFLYQIYNALKVNGLLFITVPAHMSLWSAFDEEVGHYRRYSLPDLVKIVENSNFEIRYSSYYFSLLTPIQFIQRKLFYKRNDNLRLDREHIQKHSLLGRIIIFLLALERYFIRKGWSIPFGSSCIIIARKK